MLTDNRWDRTKAGSTAVAVAPAWRVVALISVTLLLLTSLVAVDSARAETVAAGDIATVCPPAEPETNVSFGEGGVHEDAIDCFAQFGIVRGLTDGTFGAGDPLRRDQMASIILRYVQTALGAELPEAAAGFDDVDPDNVHAPAIGALTGVGIVAGVDEDTFDPAGIVTRAQMASFIVRTLDYLDDGEVNGSYPPAGEPTFDDVAEGSTHAAAIDALVALSIARGIGDGRFAPGDPVLRGQVVTFFARAAAVLHFRGDWAPGPAADPDADPDIEPDTDDGDDGGSTPPPGPGPDPDPDPEPDNTPPTIEPIDDQHAVEGEAFGPVTVQADDEDGDTLTVTVSGLPDGVAYDADTSEIAGTPDAGTAAGSPYQVTVTADDGEDQTQETFTLTVATPADPIDASATLTMNAGSGDIDASTYNTASFVLTNTGDTDLASFTLDLSTAWLPRMVFDPDGLAGDEIGKCFTADSGAGTVGLVAPGDPCVDPFSEGDAEAGYDVMTLGFDDFGPGESFTFSVDVDPDSIQGQTGSAPAGPVSGLELAGSTVTIDFDDVQATAQAVGDGSAGGALATVDPELPEPQVSLDLTSGGLDELGNPFTAHQGASVTQSAQTLDVTAPSDSTVEVLVGTAELAGGFTRTDRTQHELEANTLTAIEHHTLAVDTTGSASLDVTVPTDGSFLYIAASVAVGGGAAGPLSDVVVLGYEPEPDPAALRVNAGGGEYVDSQGWTWQADTGFSDSTSAIFPGDGPKTGEPITGTDDPLLYQSERYGGPPEGPPMDASYSLPSGFYEVELHFAEIYIGATTDPSGPATNTRVFSASAQGVPIVTDLNLYDEYGAGVAVTASEIVEVTDDTLELEFTSTADNAKVSAIAVYPTDPPTQGDDLGPDETVSDDDGSGTSPDQPLVTSVTTPASGDGYSVSIHRRTTVSSDPAGFELLGMEVVLDLSPDAPNVDDPWVVTLELDGSLVPDGEPVTVFRDGVAVDDCDNPAEVSAVPDPCVASQEATAGGGLAITIHTTAGSVWSFGVPESGPEPGDVLYRVNAGGPQLAAIDGGPAWSADTEASPSPYLVAGGEDTAGFDVGTVDPSVPGTTPQAVFETERWDPPEGAEMAWQFPVADGTPVEVRLYLMNGFQGTSQPGERVFDVVLDGATVIEGLDLSAEHGHQVAVMRALSTTSDGTVDLEFLHDVENPLVNGIEIVVDGPQPDTLSASPASLSFGDVSTSDTATSTVTLHNLGESGDPTIDVTGVSVDNAAFSTTLTDDVTLAPEAQTTFEVTFAPSSVGSTTGTLTIEHTGANSPTTVSLNGTGFDPSAAPVSFDAQTIASLSNPTAMEFGPDGRLYVAELKGMIYAYTLERDGDDYTVVDTESIDLIQTIPNHNDDGSTHASSQRNVTGLITAGTASEPVLYVSSSDPRIDSTAADTNSGMVSRLSWNGSAWEKLDLVRGLPRSAHDHLPNGLALDAASGTLYLAQGGHTNMGAPSGSFKNLPEYALSAAILSIDLDAIGESTYDLPTLKDTAEPFGGQQGDNQAMLVEGGPVQVHAPGFRNPYDVLLTEGGLLYTSDNGPNGNWGDVPDGEGGPECTNAIQEPGETHNDGLHLITGPGYYGGHPNPTRGNANNTFGGLSPVPASNPVECEYWAPGVDDDALTLFSPSSNGLAEYTASNFGGAMQGDIITTQWNGNVARVVLSSDGTDALSNTTLFSGLNGPLGITAQGDTDPFPGTVWIGQYGSGNITVFEPIDFSECDPGDLDPDGVSSNGYTYGDLMDNGLDPCNPSQVPPDFDGDFVSDLNDPDIDGDGIPNADDVFPFDPDNGRGTSLPHRLGWTSDVIGGLGGMSQYNAPGFAGLMADPSGGTDLFDQFDPDALIPGGAAGVFTVESVTVGDAHETTNTQDNAFHYGVDVTSEAGVFTVRGRIQGPFAGMTPENWQSMGITVGAGDQDNYVKLVTAANDGDGGIEFAEEIGGTFDSEMVAASIVGADYVDLYLEVDPATGTVTASYVIADDGVRGDRTVIGETHTIPAAWLDDAVNGLAVGIISTANGASEFAATWGFLEVYEGTGDTFPDLTPPATLEANPSELYLGTTEVGGSTSGTVAISHVGDPGSQEVEISAITLTGDTQDLTITDAPSTPVSLTEGQSIDVEVTHDPTVTGSPTATLEITHDGEGGTLSVPINAAATAPPDDPDAILRINAGADGQVTAGGVDWEPDSAYLVAGQEGDTYEADEPIAGTDAEEIYRTERYGNPFSYSLDLADGDYLLRLHFAELFHAVSGGSDAESYEPGDRVFDVQVDGITVVEELDLAVEVGAPLTAHVIELPVSVQGGELLVTFLLGDDGVDNAKLSALEVHELDVEYRINAGGSQQTFGHELWEADTLFTDGAEYSVSNDIAGTHRDALYQTERYGGGDDNAPFTYSLPVEDGATYLLRLHFAEIFQGVDGGNFEAGERVFDVSIDGQTVLEDYDLATIVDAPLTAVTELFEVTATSDTIEVHFSVGENGEDNAKLSALELFRP